MWLRSHQLLHPPQPKPQEISGTVPERIQADGGSETWGPRGGGVRRKGKQGTFLSGILIFWGGSSKGERKDRKLTAIAARGMEVRSKEELPDCEGLGRKWSLEPGGWRDIKARES